MNKQEILRRKIEFASPQELLFMLLSDTDKKFKDVISYWENGDSKGTLLASRLSDNVIELSSSLNTSLGDESTQEALRNIKRLYDYILDEICLSFASKDFERISKAHVVFQEIKDMFEMDRKALRN